MDFRGRVYPIPPYFNHMGSDLARSLLVFARGKPLGRTGLNWLKLHCINLTGLKKRDSVEERLRFAEEIMELIPQALRDSLHGASRAMFQNTLSSASDIYKALISQELRFARAALAKWGHQ